MSEKRTVIKIELRIEGHHIVISSHHQRIDFRQAAILADKSLIETAHKFCHLADCRLGEMHRISHAAGLEGHQPHRGVNVLLENLIRHLRRHLLDFHAALFRAHHDNTRRLAINDKGEVVFLLDVRTFLDKQAVYLLALRARLFRYQRFPEDFPGVLFDLFEVFGNLHATSLSPAASMNLRLDYHHRSAQLFGIFHCLLHAECRHSIRYVNPIGFEDCFALILMDIHSLTP